MNRDLFPVNIQEKIKVMNINILFVSWLVFFQPIWCISIDESLNNLPMDFDDFISNKKLILSGEAHYNSSNPKLEYSFITYLNKNQGFSDILLEFGHAEGYLLNKYLETGDTSFIIYNSFYPSEDYRKHWLKLLEFNRSLPKSQKLTFHGIDFERQRPAIHAVEILLNELGLDRQFAK